MKSLQLMTVLALVLAPIGAARADDAPPPVKRGGGGGGATGASLIKSSDSITGSSGLKPFLGVAGHLDVDIPTAAGGNKLVFGVDYLLGSASGLAFVLGVHFGAGGRAFLVYPLVELHYRFGLPIPLVPWIGGGVGTRLAFARDQSVNFALSFRFVGGVDYFFTPSVGLGTQLAIPDIGPLFTPTTGVVGTLEWTLGPHFRF